MWHHVSNVVKRDWELQYTPGPGEYSTSLPSRLGQGVVPFQERGECQWQKLCAVETPGEMLCSIIVIII